MDMYYPTDEDVENIVKAVKSKAKIKKVDEMDLFVISHVNPENGESHINAAILSKDLAGFSDLDLFETLEMDDFTDGVPLHDGIAIVMIMHLDENMKNQVDMVLTIDEKGLLRIEDQEGEILHERS